MIGVIVSVVVGIAALVFVRVTAGVSATFTPPIVADERAVGTAIRPSVDVGVSVKVDLTVAICVVVIVVLFVQVAVGVRGAGAPPCIAAFVGVIALGVCLNT